MLLERHKVRHDNRPLSERIRGSAHPLIEAIPARRLNQEDASTALAYARVCGLLSFDREQGFKLKLHNGELRKLGTTPHQVFHTVRKSLPDVVRIYTALGKALVNEPEELFGRLQDLKKSIADPQDDEFTALFSIKVLDRAVEESETLFLYLKNIRGNRWKSDDGNEI